MAKFCRYSCTGCRAARKKQGGFLYYFVRIESRICPMCRVYARVYGRQAYE